MIINVLENYKCELEFTIMNFLVSLCELYPTNYYFVKYDSFFNNLIMEFRFNKRVLKGYGIKVSAKAVQEASKIMPTTFNLDYDSVTKCCFDDVVNGYMISLGKDYVKKEPFSIISIALTLNFPKLSRPALLLVGYIASKIQFDSNYIELREKDFAGYSGLSNRSFLMGLKNLLK